MSRDSETVAVIGLGYIGLPTAAVLASVGINVIGVDVNSHAVETINRGEIHIVEPGLREAVSSAVSKGLLRAQQITPEAQTYIVAVPTPFKGDREPDLSYIRTAAESIAPCLQGGELIILESTSPPGATQKLAEWIIGLRPDLSLEGSDESAKVHVAHCPERVLPGKIMEEMYSNDRIIGGLTPEAAKKAESLYQRFSNGKMLLTDAKTAELSKLVENSFRDVNIAFANELSIICDKLGVDVWELIDLANHHPRVNILQPGPGVGGHCIAVDPWFIVAADPVNSQLIRQARETNDGKPKFILDKVQRVVEKGEISSVAILGLAFKADIDDLRESPAVNIASRLIAHYPEIQFYVVEPNIHELPGNLDAYSNATLVDLELAVIEADLILLLVDHKEFKDNSVLLSVSSRVELIDTRGVLTRLPDKW